MDIAYQSWRRLERVYWLLPLAFVIHDGEELLTMPAWVATHRAALADVARTLGLGDDFVESLPTTIAEAAGAIGFLFVIFVGVTLGATMRRGRGLWQYAYASVLGVFFLHLFTHVAQCIYFGGYTPGAVGAVVAGAPASVYIYRELFGAKLLSGRTAVVTALIGLALFVPGVLFAQRIGHLFASQ